MISVLPVAYIVEFGRDNETPEIFYASLAANVVQGNPRVEISFKFFKGISFQVNTPSTNSSGLNF